MGRPTPQSASNRPVKSVHWDVSIPDTPSPSYSTSTLPSSPGIETPPMHQLHLSLSPSSPNIMASPGPVMVHPILGVSSSPNLKWDVSTSLHGLVPADSKMPRSVLAEPATNPAFPTLKLIVRGMPWCITVTSPTPFICVYDVLNAIERFMDTSATLTEFQSIPTSAQRDLVNRAFTARHGGDPTIKSLGLKRIDWLCGKRHRFMGLRTSGKSGVEWELCLS